MLREGKFTLFPTHAPNWTNIVLCPIPGFISKTQLRTKGASSPEPFVIPSLGHSSGHDLAEDRHLCPVRCLKVYLSKTKPFREGKRILCISWQKNKSSDIPKTPLVGLDPYYTQSTLKPTNMQLLLSAELPKPFVLWLLLC